MVKKVPLRTCVQTKESYPKKELIRIVRTPEMQVMVDEKGKANGRGAYLKKDREVILKAQRSKALDRKLEIAVPDEIYEILLSLVDE